MKEIVIRESKAEDLPFISELWLQASLAAHHFVAADYWITNKRAMEETYLPDSEVYVVVKMNTICGFVALVGNHLASIFVATEQQGNGIGSILLNHVKNLRTEMTLSVYQKNEKSIRFYQSKGFTISAETIDQPTGEKEFIMQWHKMA